MLKVKSKRTKKPLPNFREIIPNKLSNHSEFMETWNNFVVHRTKMNKPLTKISVKRIMKMFNRTNRNIPDLCIKCLRFSIMEGWQGVFPINS